MMNWSSNQKELLEKYSSLSDIPMEDRVYKCSATGCKKIIKAEYLVDGSCPSCGSDEFLTQQCPLDIAGCSHTSTSGIEVCPLCGEMVCPECGSHDVTIMSRVTGYGSDTSQWNKAKQEELKDRVRHHI